MNFSSLFHPAFVNFNWPNIDGSPLAFRAHGTESEPDAIKKERTSDEESENKHRRGWCQQNPINMAGVNNNSSRSLAEGNLLPPHALSCLQQHHQSSNQSSSSTPTSSIPTSAPSSTSTPTAHDLFLGHQHHLQHLNKNQHPAIPVEYSSVSNPSSHSQHPISSPPSSSSNVPSSSSNSSQPTLFKTTLKSIPPSEKVYQCDDCGQCYSRKGNFITHCRIHTGEKPFQCTECTEQFASSSALARHNRTHSADKPFACVDCGKKMIKLQTLPFTH
ncbi:hypothetical protein FOCC_FOCC004584 [Frankliniella occidentalis]|nr:hypothetical protein FOCC_FOCC004584 [Frankliniella occidentalis]